MHVDLESLGLDAEISGVLRSAERTGAARGVQVSYSYLITLLEILLITFF